MANRTHRHVRLRLARQRVTPDRIRARVRSRDEPRTVWQRIPWAHVGTVIGALAAIGGLVFTAVATYYSAAVSDDQLQESRQAADRAERAQAARVSFWVDTESGDRRFHVMNRSPDPVTEVSFRGGAPLTGPVLMTWDSLAPCQDFVIPVTSVVKPGALMPGDPELDFRDRNGKAWQRTEVALNPIGHGVPPVDGTTYVAGQHGAEVHDAPDCGDDAG